MKKFSEMPMPMSKKAKKTEEKPDYEMELFGEEGEEPSEMDAEKKPEEDLFGDEKAEGEESMGEENAELSAMDDEVLKKELEKRGYKVS